MESQMERGTLSQLKGLVNLTLSFIFKFPVIYEEAEQ